MQFKIIRRITISVHARHHGNTNSMVDLKVAGAVAVLCVTLTYRGPIIAVWYGLGSGWFEAFAASDRSANHPLRHCTVICFHLMRQKLWNVLFQWRAANSDIVTNNLNALHRWIYSLWNILSQENILCRIPLEYIPKRIFFPNVRNVKKRVLKMDDLKFSVMCSLQKSLPNTLSVLLGNDQLNVRTHTVCPQAP